MNFRVDQGKAESYACELLLLFSFDSSEKWEGPIRSVDTEWKGFLSNLMNQGDFKGDLYQCQLLYTHVKMARDGAAAISANEML